MKTDKLAIPLAIIFAGAMIAGALYLSNIKAANVSKNTNTNTNTTEVGNMRKVTSDDHILGNPNAELIIVEYSDIECPFCKMFHPTLHKIISEYGPSSKVAWVYRHFPIDSLHSKARKEMEATECVNEIAGSTKFWEYLNMIYDNTPGNNGLDPAKLPEYAKAIGVDVSTFNTCLSSGKYASKIEADYQDAISSYGNTPDSERGTPHSVIISKDGTKTPINGAYPYDNLKTIIDAMLK